MSDHLDRLERLTSLFERGALSKEEFEHEKALLLRSGGASASDVPSEKLFDKRNWLLIGAGAAAVIGAIAGVFAAVDLSEAAKPPGKLQKNGSMERASLSFDSFISFKDASSCTPSSGLRGLLDDLARAATVDNAAADGYIRVAGLEEPLIPVTARAEVAGAQASLAAIRLDGTWQGLHVKEIRTVRWSDGHGDGFRIQFAEGPGQAGSVLRLLGMDLPKLGTIERRGDQFVGLEADHSGSALVCASAEEAIDADPGSLTSVGNTEEPSPL